MRVGTRNHHLARFDGLAQGFKKTALKFWQFIHEQDPVMGQ